MSLAWRTANEYPEEVIGLSAATRTTRVSVLHLTRLPPHRIEPRALVVEGGVLVEPLQSRAGVAAERGVGFDLLAELVRTVE
jgi:hypothetical protein